MCRVFAWVFTPPPSLGLPLMALLLVASELLFPIGFPRFGFHFVGPVSNGLLLPVRLFRCVAAIGVVLSGV
ncbi:hypothetical protein D8674_034816 [Pyrus ussuriensis x Pyrus communis]|uniref:Uncharacterized protein n=1 Tax=Pyrus ussuriensis x Pyrus communis TaxID=2448454 RepID=A0A5N5GGL9_9ROSA|nr:hypothetical protein D8674_034816 [Pyrus ussuriensis x Pyrus communis]